MCVAEFYPQVTSTRTYEDRLQTIEFVRQAGISVCAGGIIGLGEGKKDRVGLLHTVRLLPACWANWRACGVGLDEGCLMCALFAAGIAQHATPPPHPPSWLPHLVSPRPPLQLAMMQERTLRACPATLSTPPHPTLPLLAAGHHA